MVINRSRGPMHVVLLTCLTLGLAACDSDAASNPDVVDNGSAPTLTSTNPISGGVGVAINASIAGTFSEPMDKSTFKPSTFTVRQGSTEVPGTVVYANSTAVFTPTSNLATNTSFTATISTDAQDIEGNALAAPYSWSFVTGTTIAQGPASVGLGDAGAYAVLAKTGISTVPPSAVTGDLGLSPAAASFVTGFSLVADATNVFSLSTQVIGSIYAADYAVPTPMGLTTAISNMENAYTDAAGRPTPDFLELGTGNIGGQTLAPGLYKWTSTVTIPADLTIAGGPNDVWIFQTSGDIFLSAAVKITLAGGAQAKNIFWQVAGEVTLGAGSHFEGIILSQTAITLETGATMNGRALAQTQVVLQQATIVEPAL